MSKFKLFLIGLAVVVVTIGVPIGIWGLTVALSGPVGAGEQEKKINSRDNRIFAQEHFPELYNIILAYDQQLDQAAADKLQHPNDSFFITNYSGLVKQCIDARNQYNADADKVTQERWRDEKFPYHIDQFDPRTDCKENK